MHPTELDPIVDQTRPLWEELRNGRIFITGGTGFIGCWLLESFARANDILNLGAEIHVLTRDLQAFERKSLHLARRADIKFHIGDVRTFNFPTVGKYSHFIHAATEASAKLNDENPALMLDTIISGTRRALDFAVDCGAKKFLLTSSGAVYGKQPPEITHITEDYAGAPDVSSAQSAYGEGKRISELLCAIYSRQYAIETKIARCFAFVGPYLPLDAHFAIGNFIRDAMAAHPITVKGDGSPFRSYLYAGDLAVWLWTILFRGASNRPYNVGSSSAVSIAQTAAAVSRSFPGNLPVNISQETKPGQPAARYVPDTSRARSELNLTESVPLKDAIRRTAHWHENRDKN